MFGISLSKGNKMNKYDAWLESPYRESEDREAQIDERITELLHGEMNPDNFDNFQEAICEECLYQHKDSIEEALRNNDKATLGLLVQSAVFTYWEKKAISEAENENE
jgi:hypothetical protein